MAEERSNVADKQLPPRALDGLRVLDLANPMGLYCTKLLADLGADVIKVEPPGGDPVRNTGPFLNDEPHPEKSLHWFHLNTNKRSVTLNLDSVSGRDILRALIERSDVVVDTFSPGQWDEMGLSYRKLKEANPRLILVSVTAFGQTGPWRDYKASDMVGLALGGIMYISGWPDLPPGYIAAHQAHYHVSLQAAAATLLALYSRDISGAGQHIDVSMHESVPLCLLHAVPNYAATGSIPKRIGNEHKMGSLSLAATGVFACKDGYVDIRFRYIQRWAAFVDWLDGGGMAGDLKEDRWRDFGYRNHPESIRHIDEVLGAFFMTRAKKELFEEGQTRGFEIAPVNTPRDVAEDAHLRDRNFFTPVNHPELGMTLRYLGAPYQLSQTPWSIRHRPPLIGEHNAEIYEGELGYSRTELVLLKQAGVI